MNYNLNGKGIFVFSDPAGANAILAIIDSFLKKGKRPLKDFLIYSDKQGVFPRKYKNLVNTFQFNDNKAEKVFAKFKPDYLLSATSIGSFEHNWRKVAQKKKIFTDIRKSTI